jgi:hypothetical protein
MARLDSNKVTEVYVVDNPDDAVNKAYLDNNSYPNPSGSELVLSVTNYDGEQWIIRTIPPRFTDVANIASTNDYFITGYLQQDLGVYSLSGLLLASTDAITWSIRTLPFPSDPVPGYPGVDPTIVQGVYVVGAGGGVYVATGRYTVSGGNFAVTSTDTIHWTLRTLQPPPSINYYYYDYSYLNGSHHLFGPLNAYVTSTNGIFWQSRSSAAFSANSTIRSINYVNSLYIMTTEENDIGNVGRVSVSTNSIHWELRTIPTDYIYYDQTYVDNLYLLVGTIGSVIVSTDTINWVMRTGGIPSSSSFVDVVSANNQAFALSSFNTTSVHSSTDTIHWGLKTTINIGTFTYFSDLHYSNSKNILLLNGSSTPLQTGKIVTSNIASKKWVPKKGTTESARGSVLYDIPGSYTFNIPRSASTLYIEAMGAGGGGASASVGASFFGSYAGAGGGSGAYESYIIDRDLYGLDWLNLTVGSGGVGGNNRGVSISTDGIIWTQGRSGLATNSATLSAISYSSNMKFIIGGPFGPITSTNGINWSLRTLAGNEVSKVFNSKLSSISMLSTSFLNRHLATSTNGIQWSLRTLGSNVSGNVTSISEGTNTTGTVYLVATTSGGYVTSTNTIHWTNRTVGASIGVNSTFLAFKDSLFILGNSSLIRSSTDAIHWTARTSGTINTINNITASSFTSAFKYFASFTQTTNQFIVSTDGIQWSLRTVPGFTGVTNIVNSISSNLYIAGNSLGQLATSTDTIHWSNRTALFATKSITSIDSDGTTIAAVGGINGNGGSGGNTSINFVYKHSQLGTTTASIIITSGSGGVAAAGGGGAGAIITPTGKKGFLISRSGQGGVSPSSSAGAGSNIAGTFSYISTGGAGGGWGSARGGSAGIIAYNDQTSRVSLGGTADLSINQKAQLSQTLNAPSAISLSSVMYIGSGGGGGGAESRGPHTWHTRTLSFNSHGSIEISNTSGRYFVGSINGGYYYAVNSSPVQSSDWTLTYVFGGGDVLLYAPPAGAPFDIVAFNNAGGLAVSTNSGVNWSVRTVPSAGLIIYSVAYNNLVTEKWVAALTGSNRLASSTDTIHWTLRTGAHTPPYYKVRASVGTAHRYITAGTAARVSVSSDAIHWVLRTSGIPTTNELRSLVINESSNIFITGGGNGFLASSTDTIHWQLRTAATVQPIYSINYMSGYYALTAASGVLRVSTDLIVWRGIWNNTFNDIMDTAMANNKLYAVGLSGFYSFADTSPAYGAGNGGSGTGGGGGGGGGYAPEEDFFGLGGNGGDGYIRITWW